MADRDTKFVYMPNYRITKCGSKRTCFTRLACFYESATRFIDN